MVGKKSTSQDRKPTITIDRDATIAQLKALGYKRGDSVFLRFFYPKEDPRSKEDWGRKLSVTLPSIPWAKIEQFQKEGRGAYFVVNGGGDTDDKVKVGRAVFFEHDNLSKDDQIGIWKVLGLPTPTLQVDTGGKSIHTYYTLKEPCTVAQWVELQVDLLEWVQGDRKLKNPSRVMRLAGCFHVKPGALNPTTILTNTGNMYTYEELRAIVPRSNSNGNGNSNGKRWHEFDRNFRFPISVSVPLFECLSRESRDLIERGIGEGGRNDRGYALACDLIGTTDYLGTSGQPYEGDPLQLFNQFAHNCTPPLSDGEVESIWKSANKRSSGASLSPEQIQGCVKGWYWRNSQKNDQHNVVVASKTANADAAPTQMSAPSIDLNARLSAIADNADAIIAEGHSEWKELELLFQLQANSGISKESFWELVRERRTLHDLKEEVERIAKKIDRPSLDWGKAPESLSHLNTQMFKDAKKRSIDPITLLAFILPAVGTLVRRDVVSNFQGAKFPAILWTSLLMESGDGKTRAENLTMSPLKAMQLEATKRYKAAKLARDRAVAEAKKRKDECFEDEYPEVGKEKIVFEITTIQGLLVKLSKSPSTAGSLWLRDEQAGLFKSLGQFSSKDNEDLEILLSLWDCNEVVISDRVDDDKCLEVENPHVGMAGGLQPGKFSEVFKKADDNDGLAARVLFFYPNTYIDRHKPGDVYLPVMLRQVYESIQHFSSRTIEATDAAYALWRETSYQVGLEARRIKPRNAALSVWMKKGFTHIGRLATALHLLECGCNPDKNKQVLTVETVEFAIELFNYCKLSYEYMLSQGRDSDDIQAVLTKIMDRVNTMGSLTAREAVTYIRAIGRLAKESRRSPTAYALDLFSQLVEMGKCRIEQSGRTRRLFPLALETSAMSAINGSQSEQGIQGADIFQSAASALEIFEENHEHTPTTSTRSVDVQSGERGRSDRRGNASLPANSTERPPSQAGTRETGVGDIPPATSTTPPEGARNGHRRDAGQNTTPIHPTAKKDEVGHQTRSKGDGAKPQQETQEQHPQSTQSNEPVLKVGDRVRVLTANGPETGVIEEINAEGFCRCSGEGFFAWFGPSEISLIE